MKTLKTILMTIGVLTLLFLGFFYRTGNLKVERVEKQHNVVVVIDGVEQCSADWTDVLGYKYSIDLVDGIYIGR